MSFPNIPDINPDINIKLEDALNLLLTSIALEEISLSKLMNAETKKILFVLDECKLKDATIQDALDINKSVNQTIKNMIKLQMLLQFKLENVTELLPSTTTTSTTTTSTTTTTTSTCTRTSTTHTTTCSTSTSTTTTKAKCKCGLKGKGKGYVSNQLDEFYCETAVLQAYIDAYICDINQCLCYSVQNNDELLCMTAYTDCITIKCPSKLHPYSVILCGKCRIEKKSECHSDIIGNGCFILKVWNRKEGKNGFHMIIVSEDKPKLNHNSGFIHMKNSTLKIVG
jgi:hypothetical protein